MENAKRTSSANNNSNKDRVLRPAWCECPDDPEQTIYMPDNVCPCGVDKHHYHCVTCKGIWQVG